MCPLFVLSSSACCSSEKSPAPVLSLDFQHLLHMYCMILNPFLTPSTIQGLMHNITEGENMY